jgi:hypothetical protein
MTRIENPLLRTCGDQGLEDCGLHHAHLLQAGGARWVHGDFA